MKPITFFQFCNFHADGSLYTPTEQRAVKNCAWVRGKVAERGWTQQIEDQAQYLIELGLDRLRAEERCGT